MTETVFEELAVDVGVVEGVGLGDAATKPNIVLLSLPTHSVPSPLIATDAEIEPALVLYTQFTPPDALTEYKYPLCVPTYTFPFASIDGDETTVPVTVYDQRKAPADVYKYSADPQPKYRLPDASTAGADWM